MPSSQATPFPAASHPLAGRTVLQIIPELDTGGAELSAVEISDAIVRAGGRAIVLSEGGRLATRITASGGGAPMVRARGQRRTRGGDGDPRQDLPRRPRWRVSRHGQGRVLGEARRRRRDSAKPAGGADVLIEVRSPFSPSREHLMRACGNRRRARRWRHPIDMGRKQRLDRRVARRRPASGEPSQHRRQAIVLR